MNMDSTTISKKSYGAGEIRSPSAGPAGGGRAGPPGSLTCDRGTRVVDNQATPSRAATGGPSAEKGAVSSETQKRRERKKRQMERERRQEYERRTVLCGLMDEVNAALDEMKEKSPASDSDSEPEPVRRLALKRSGRDVTTTDEARGRASKMADEPEDRSNLAGWTGPRLPARALDHLLEGIWRTLGMKQPEDEGFIRTLNKIMEGADWSPTSTTGGEPGDGAEEGAETRPERKRKEVTPLQKTAGDKRARVCDPPSSGGGADSAPAPRPRPRAPEAKTTEEGWMSPREKRKKRTQGGDRPPSKAADAFPSLPAVTGEAPPRVRGRAASAAGRGDTRRPRRKRPPRARGPAIALRVPERASFAEVLKRAKEHAGPDVNGVSAVRQSREGRLLIEFQPNTDIGAVFDRIKGKMADCGAQRLSPMRDLEITGMDAATEPAEIIKAIAKEAGTEIRNVRCKIFRTAPRETRAVVVECPEAVASKIARMGTIRIGWLRCRVREAPRVTRCFACHGLGHVARTCTVNPSGEEWCRKCGATGHGMGECTSAPSCRLCKRRGLTGNATSHVAASVRCPVYKEEAAKSAAGRKT